ncbi:MFS general substrate transporter [Polyplosphaeria fusca]|uniref:MFS general substrate transporter n=1 Tax=Polyplosphaeria fusca TaxID=682080 RepID=A0A9P4QM17_9PLEO|nr:MFS general substrate transporter [Polyplosphaeria fusca]
MEEHDDMALSAGRRASRRYFICIFTLKFLVQLTSALIEIPAVQLFEAAVCRDYHQQWPLSSAADHDTSLDCKLAPIQDKLALVMGLKVTFDAVPGLITSLWYGSLANRRGRRFVMALAIVGSLLSWAWVCIICFSNHGPRVEFAWMGSLFYLIGGGSRLLLAMVFTTCVDVVPWDRSQVLFYLHAMTHFARMFGPPLAASLMQRRLQYPFVLALSSMLIQLILVAILPETLPVELQERSNRSRRSGQASDSSSMVSVTTPVPPALESVRAMLGHVGLVIAFAAFVVKRAAFSSENLSFQYASEKMGKRLYQTVWLRVMNTIGATIVLSTVLPLLGHFGPWKTPRKDLAAMRGSLLVAVTGFSILFLSRDFVTLCLGMATAGFAEGLEASLQALGSYIVGDPLNAMFFALVSMLDLVGEIIGGPLMAAAYRIRDASGRPAGFHFLISAVRWRRATIFARH